MIIDHLYEIAEEAEQGAVAQLLLLLEVREHNVDSIARSSISPYVTNLLLFLCRIYCSSNYNGWRDSCKTIFQAYQLSAGMKFFGMRDLDSRPTKHADILLGS